jgi:hypothetical protein
MTKPRGGSGVLGVQEARQATKDRVRILVGMASGRYASTRLEVNAIA